MKWRGKWPDKFGGKYAGRASRGGSSGNSSHLVWEWDASTLSMVPQIGTGTPTVTRAGNTATRVNSAGLIETVNANLPRFDYDPTTLALRGLLVEEARTQVALHNRDLTNAVWAASNITAAKDQTGVDGVANSASSITATAGNGTILQSITLASSARFQTAYVKRITGTGTVNMTMDNGSTWTVVTVTSSWTRVSIPTQTLANPIVGFRLVTDTDAIAVDFVQNENGAFATSAITAAGASTVSRAADVITLATSAIADFSATTLTMFAEAYPQVGNGSGTSTLIALDDGTANERHALLGTAALDRIRLLSTDGGSAQFDATSGAGTWPASTVRRVAVALAANSGALSIGGALTATDSSITMATPTTLCLGNRQGGTAATMWNAPIRKVRLYDARMPNAFLQTITT